MIAQDAWMRRTPPLAVAIALAMVLSFLLVPAPVYGQGAEAPTAPKTAKERQAGKAYDPQRVNDCKVPPELRADKTRSADCGEKAKAAEKQGEAASAAEGSD